MLKKYEYKEYQLVFYKGTGITPGLYQYLRFCYTDRSNPNYDKHKIKSRDDAFQIFTVDSCDIRPPTKIELILYGREKSTKHKT